MAAVEVGALDEAVVVGCAVVGAVVGAVVAVVVAGSVAVVGVDVVVAVPAVVVGGVSAATGAGGIATRSMAARPAVTHAGAMAGHYGESVGCVPIRASSATTSSSGFEASISCVQVARSSGSTSAICTTMRPKPGSSVSTTSNPRLCSSAGAVDLPVPRHAGDEDAPPSGTVEPC
jgi:hypothetical protein